MANINVDRFSTSVTRLDPLRPRRALLCCFVLNFSLHHPLFQRYRLGMPLTLRKSCVNVSTSQAPHQDPIKLSLGITYAIQLEERVARQSADETTTWISEPSLPFTCKLYINGCPCDDFAESIFAQKLVDCLQAVSEAANRTSLFQRSTIVFVLCHTQNSPAWSIEAGGIEVHEGASAHEVQGASLVSSIFAEFATQLTTQLLTYQKANLAFKRVPAHTGIVLSAAPQLKAVTMTCKLTDGQGPETALLQTVHREPLSLSLTCLLERASHKLVTGFAKRFPLIANVEFKEVERSVG